MKLREGINGDIEFIEIVEYFYLTLPTKRSGQALPPLLVKVRGEDKIPKKMSEKKRFPVEKMHEEPNSA